MIRIDKPKPGPTILTTRGRIATEQLRKQFTDNCLEYRTGKIRFTFDKTIYADITVKESLIQAQHGKCCFCESIVGNDGDIEHFRPKGASRQSRTSKLIRPGYYWLAYDWDNLFLACPGCNSRHKANLFPLINPEARSLDHSNEVSSEQPFFVHPTQDDPADHIGFRGEVAYGKTKRGRATSDALALNRPNILQRRKERLAILELLVKSIRINRTLKDPEAQNLIKETQQFLNQSVLPSAEYTAMVRSAFPEIDIYLATPHQE